MNSLISLLLVSKFGGDFFVVGNSDTHGYLSLAENIAKGNGFMMYEFTSALRTPLYPLYLSLFYIFGLPIGFLVLGQFVFFGISTVLVYKIGELLFSKRIAKLATIFFTLEPLLLFLNSAALSESLFLMLVLWAVYFLVKFWLVKSDHNYLLLVGFCFGLATLTRPITQYTPALVLVVLLVISFLKKLSWQKLLLSFLAFLITFLAVIFPWAIRQKSVFNSWRLSNVDTFVLYFRTLPLAEATEHNITYREAVDKLIKELPEKIENFDRFKMEHTLLYDQELRKEIKTKVLQHWPVVSKYYILSGTSAFFATGYDRILETVGLERSVNKPNFTELLRQKEYGQFFAGIFKFDLFNLIFVFGLAVWFLIYILIISALLIDRKNKKNLLSAVFLLGMVAYFSVFALGPSVYVRYRILAYPYLFLLLAYSLDLLLKKSRLLGRISKPNKNNNMEETQKIEKWPTQIGVGTCELSPRVKEYVNKALDTNRLSYGPFTKTLEAEFAKAHNAKFAIFVNSGTSALRISLAALKEFYKWEDGDEVIIPSITFVSDVNVVTHNRLTPVFVDVDPKTYNIDPEKIAEKITSKTKAILPTHLCGLASDMEKIMEIAGKHDLRVIEDACESSFAAIKGKPVGSFGDIGCYSTYQAHIMATGVGGFATTNNPELAVILRSLANHGRDGIYMQIDDDKGKSSDELKQIVNRRFSFVRPGYSFRATEMEAAIGLAQMEDGIEDEISKRQSNAKKLIEVLSKYEQLQLPSWGEDYKHVFMMFPILINKDSGINRDDFAHYLELHNIETRHILPLINQPFVIEAFGDMTDEHPVADHINKNGFYIGCHPSLREDEIEYIDKVFGVYLESKQ